jgi:hypothetical protein
MRERDFFTQGESPFLLEALSNEAALPELSSMEWQDEVSALAQRVSPAARVHLEHVMADEGGEGESEDEADAGLMLFEDPQPAASARDTELAVPPFGPGERGKLAQPLAAKKLALAAERNAKMHPASGVTPEDLRSALRDYVDLDPVARAVAGRSGGTGGFDAGLIEAIHTFQSKCYFAPKSADGIAGPSTLESLGFVRHKLKKVDATFAGAQAALRAKAKSIEQAIDGRWPVARWFADFINPSFLGHTFSIGVHPLLVEALRKAERHLLAQQAYKGLTPVALGRALGFTPEREQHKGGRRNPNMKGSFHGPGLAVDIRYLANPWIAGNPDAPNGNKRFIKVMERATLLLRGRAERVDSAFLSRLAAQPTAAICSELRGLSDLLKSYLALAKDDAQRGAALERQQAVSGVLESGESLERAAQRWQKTIALDVEALRNKGDFGGRDGRRGFFDLPTDLVVALRDRAGLAWGAVDFGAKQSGDVMHFDLRCAPIGRALRPGSCADGHGAPEKPAKPAKPKSAPTKPLTQIVPPGKTLYASIPVQAAQKTSRVGIFVPERFRPRGDVDLVIYLHGLLSPCASPGPDIDQYWEMGLAKPKQTYGTGPTALRESLNASARNAILVAPSLGADSNANRLVARGGFDRLVEQVLATLRDRAGLATAPQSVRQIVLAGHSKGGAHMRAIAHSADAMTARIREIWGFDCFYSTSDPAFWADWCKRNPARRLLHFYRTKPGEKKPVFKPWRFNEQLRVLAAKDGLTNLELVDANTRASARENHCSIPMTFLQKQLEASAFLAGV